VDVPAELDIQPLTGSVELSLLQAVIRRKVLRLRLDERERDRLRVGIHPHAENVVRPAAAPGRSSPCELNRSRSLLAADEVFCPSACVQARIEQLGARVGF
jgi:hypothetical protein